MNWSYRAARGESGTSLAYDAVGDGNAIGVTPQAAIVDVDERDFEQRVLERSRELPVVVDFWAAWCGPCKQLTPVLERATAARPGRVELAKVDVDSNQGLAAAFRIQGIPAVKAFRDGRVAAEFTGALPPAEVERFFDSLVPSEADDLAGTEDEDALRRALEIDPAQALARRKLGRILLERGEEPEALELLEGATGDYVADGLVARAHLGDAGLAPAFEAWDGGDFERALALLLDALPDPDRQDLIRRVMVGIFTELGADHPLARDYRRRLSSALN
jgi:putative thioredoxin